MNRPAFFEQAPSITIHDGLAGLLGAGSDGVAASVLSLITGAAGSG
jgi:hypothetical protein